MKRDTTMLVRRCCLVVAALLIALTHLPPAAHAGAQDDEPEAASGNVLVDIRLATDEDPRPRLARLLIQTGGVGTVRSLDGNQADSFSVEAAPALLGDGRIRLELSVELLGSERSASRSGRFFHIDQSVSVVLEDGAPLTAVLDATGPYGDRAFTVEATATAVGAHPVAAVARADRRPRIDRLEAKGNVEVDGRITADSIEIELPPDPAEGQRQGR